MEIDANGLLELAKRLAKEAGDMIRVAFNEPKREYDRKSLTDPVTETDREVENFIFNELRRTCPGHKFIGEESSSEGGIEWTDAPTWIVANFVHRIPMVAVSIGFTLHRKILVGVIYNPILNELFEATSDGPARLNGRAIRVSAVSGLHSACVSTELGSDRSLPKTNMMLDQLGALLRSDAQCVRAMGSCALDLANLACGRIDAFYESGPYPWDLAAGVLIATRAGGVVRGAKGTVFDLCGRVIVACTPSLVPEIAPVLGWDVLACVENSKQLDNEVCA